MKFTIETAGEIMTSPPFCLNASTNVSEAAHTLVNKHFHGAPVVNDDDELVGVVSESDLLAVIAGAAFHALPAGHVADFMSRDPQTAETTDDIYTITRHFQRGRASRLPVMENGRCVGIITRRNLLLALQRLTGFHDKEPRETYEVLAKLRSERDGAA